VKALIEKFRCFGERVARPQHEKIRRSFSKGSAASGTSKCLRIPVEPPATIRTSDDLKELRRDHGEGWPW
jgi:hypothetical protein